MKRFICIHGHFYQPPRENAWLERVERQESARPFHDWNARIEAECYGPNARARILAGDDTVVAVVNNFEKISFNVGPTLLSWLELHAPTTYARILEADAASAAKMGRGSAMAQAYNHMIMPLASPRDRRTQVRWGVYDFERRFGRKPEGMWLPETAACTESLQALADEGITFTLLSPTQAASIKKQGAAAFVPVATGGLDTRRPYLVKLGEGRSITVFFYDGSTSQAVAFERLLSNGDLFAGRLKGAFSPTPTTPELVHIATDGETYGHHHRFGEMALAYALRKFEADPNVELTNYASFLAKHPAVDEAAIVENSSWSCAHGVGRWSADCGCRMRGDTNQAWRGPLREALDWISKRLDAVFETEGSKLLLDPWAARDGYIAVIMDRSAASVAAFFAAHGKPSLGEGDRGRALALLEMQRHRMLMYTSCGWFFDDVSGLETTQVLQYAARALELCRSFGHDELEAELLKRLTHAQAITPDTISGREVYERSVVPTMIDSFRVAATFAVTSLFGVAMVDAPAFDIHDREVRSTKRDDTRLAAGRLDVRNRVTGELDAYAFAVQHEGGPTVRGGLRRLAKSSFDEDSDESQSWLSAFDESPESVRGRMDTHLPLPIVSLRTLPVDERILVVERILAQAVRSAEAAYRQVFTENAALLTELAATGVKPPRALSAASRVVLEADLLRAARKDHADTRALRNLLAEARAENVPFDEQMLAFELGLAIGRTIAELQQDPGDDRAIGRLADLVEIGHRLQPSFDLSRAQDLVWTVVNEPSSPLAHLASERGRIGAWRELAKAVRIRVSPS